MFGVVIQRVFLLAFCCFAVTAVSGTKDARQQLEERIVALKSVSGSFVQESTGANERLQRESGTFYIKQPGSFRWTTAEPFRQDVVVRGDRVWMIDDELEQVIVQHRADLGQTPAQLLVGETTLLDQYRVTVSSVDKKQVFTLLPRESSSPFEKLVLVFNKKRVVDSLELTDALGAVRRIRFSGVSVNRTLKDDTFEVELPKGYDVIDETRREGDVR